MEARKRCSRDLQSNVNYIFFNCSNYIFILDLTPSFNELGKDRCKMTRELFKFWDLVHLILETLRYLPLAGGQQHYSAAIFGIHTTAVHDTFNKYGDFINLYFTFSLEILWKLTGTYCQRNIRCFGLPSYLLLGSDQLNVTVCQPALCRCGMYS